MTPAEQIERAKLVDFHSSRLEHLMTTRMSRETPVYLRLVHRATVRRTLSELAGLGVAVPRVAVWNGPEACA